MIASGPMSAPGSCLSRYAHLGFCHPCPPQELHLRSSADDMGRCREWQGGDLDDQGAGQRRSGASHSKRAPRRAHLGGNCAHRRHTSPERPSQGRGGSRQPQLRAALVAMVQAADRRDGEDLAVFVCRRTRTRGVTLEGQVQAGVAGQVPGSRPPTPLGSSGSSEARG